MRTAEDLREDSLWRNFVEVTEDIWKKSPLWLVPFLIVFFGTLSLLIAPFAFVVPRVSFLWFGFQRIWWILRIICHPIAWIRYAFQVRADARSEIEKKREPVYMAPPRRMERLPTVETKSITPSKPKRRWWKKKPKQEVALVQGKQPARKNVAAEEWVDTTTTRTKSHRVIYKD